MNSRKMFHAGYANDGAATPPVPTVPPTTLHSALSVDQWQALEHAVFDGSGHGLTALRDHARGAYKSPVGFLVLAAQWALTSLPAGAFFDAGLGKGALNTFVALVGEAGMGKDSHVLAVGRAMHITTGTLMGGTVLAPRLLQLGSGEGIMTALKPDKDGPSVPTLFGMSEVGQMGALMGRTGSTLRGNVLSMYSGNALGVSNKTETIAVPANSYTAGLWVGVQPDKAGVLLDGGDDGLKHRFIWSELIDPGAPEAPDQGVPLPPISVPDTVTTDGFTFAPEIMAATRAAARAKLVTGAVATNAGHRNQTRLKLACGLALLESSTHVTLEVWGRAGALMDYSDTVQRWCGEHLESRRVSEDVDRLERKEQADERLEAGRSTRARQKIVDALESEPRVQWAGRDGVLQTFASRMRGVANEAVQSLINQGVVNPIMITPNSGGDPVLDSLTRGDSYPR